MRSINVRQSSRKSMPLEYDVVLLPEDKLREQAMAVSQSLKTFGTLFALDDRRFHPHLSLYFGVRLEDSALPKVAATLKSIAEHYRPLHLTASHYQQQRGYIGVHYERSKDIAALHQEVLEDVSPLRAQAPTPNFNDVSDSQRANLQRYGWDKAGELYEPHLTFTRFQNRNENHLKDLPLGSQTFNGAFPTLGLFELGPNGTCIRQLFAFDLRKI